MFLLGKPALLCESVARLPVAQETAGRVADAAATLSAFPRFGTAVCFARRYEAGSASKSESAVAALLANRSRAVGG